VDKSVHIQMIIPAKQGFNWDHYCLFSFYSFLDYFNQNQQVTKNL